MGMTRENKPLKPAAEKSCVSNLLENKWREVFTFRKLTEADHVAQGAKLKANSDPDSHE